MLTVCLTPAVWLTLMRPSAPWFTLDSRITNFFSPVRWTVGIKTLTLRLLLPVTWSWRLHWRSAHPNSAATSTGRGPGNLWHVNLFSFAVYSRMLNVFHFGGFIRFKLLKWWAQSFLPGVPRVVAGFRDHGGTVVSVDTFPISKVSQLIKVNCCGLKKY